MLDDCQMEDDVNDTLAFYHTSRHARQVRGMCHRNQASDQPITDLRTVYSVGDRVKAVVLVVSKDETHRVHTVRVS